MQPEDVGLGQSLGDNLLPHDVLQAIRGEIDDLKRESIKKIVLFICTLLFILCVLVVYTGSSNFLGERFKPAQADSLYTSEVIDIASIIKLQGDAIINMRNVVRLAESKRQELEKFLSSKNENNGSIGEVIKSTSLATTFQGKDTTRDLITFGQEGNSQNQRKYKMYFSRFGVSRNKLYEIEFKQEAIELSDWVEQSSAIAVSPHDYIKTMSEKSRKSLCELLIGKFDKLVTDSKERLVELINEKKQSDEMIETRLSRLASSNTIYIMSLVNKFTIILILFMIDVVALKLILSEVAHLNGIRKTNIIMQYCETAQKPFAHYRDMLGLLLDSNRLAKVDGRDGHSKVIKDLLEIIQKALPQGSSVR